jgi:hypothetical protein
VLVEEKYCLMSCLPFSEENVNIKLMQIVLQSLRTLIEFCKDIFLTLILAARKSGSSSMHSENVSKSNTSLSISKELYFCLASAETLAGKFASNQEHQASMESIVLDIECNVLCPTLFIISPIRPSLAL